MAPRLATDKVRAEGSMKHSTKFPRNAKRVGPPAPEHPWPRAASRDDRQVGGHSSYISEGLAADIGLRFQIREGHLSEVKTSAKMSAAPGAKLPRRLPNSASAETPAWRAPPTITG